MGSEMSVINKQPDEGDTDTEDTKNQEAETPREQPVEDAGVGSATQKMDSQAESQTKDLPDTVKEGSQEKSNPVTGNNSCETSGNISQTTATTSSAPDSVCPPKTATSEISQSEPGSQSVSAPSSEEMAASVDLSETASSEMSESQSFSLNTESQSFYVNSEDIFAMSESQHFVMSENQPSSEMSQSQPPSEMSENQLPSDMSENQASSQPAAALSSEKFDCSPASSITNSTTTSTTLPLVSSSTADGVTGSDIKQSSNTTGSEPNETGASHDVIDDDSDQLIKELDKYIDKDREQDKKTNPERIQGKSDLDRSALFEEDSDSDDESSGSNISPQQADDQVSSQKMDTGKTADEGSQSTEEEKQDYSTDQSKTSVVMPETPKEVSSITVADSDEEMVNADFDSVESVMWKKKRQKKHTRKGARNSTDGTDSTANKNVTFGDSKDVDQVIGEASLSLQRESSKDVVCGNRTTGSPEEDTCTTNEAASSHPEATTTSSKLDGMLSQCSDADESFDAPLVIDTGESQSLEASENKDSEHQSDQESTSEVVQPKPQSIAVPIDDAQSSVDLQEMSPNHCGTSFSNTGTSAPGAAASGQMEKDPAVKSDEDILNQPVSSASSGLYFKRQGSSWHCSCGFTQSSLELFADHILHHCINYIALCDHCPTLFCDLSTFKNHISEKHPSETGSIDLLNHPTQQIVLSLMKQADNLQVQPSSSSNTISPSTKAASDSEIQTDVDQELQRSPKVLMSEDDKNIAPSSNTEQSQEKNTDVSIDLTSEEQSVLTKNDPEIHSSERLLQRFIRDIKAHSSLVAASNPTQSLDCGFIDGKFRCISCNWDIDDVTKFHIHVLVHVHRKNKNGIRICKTCMVPGSPQILAMKCKTILDLMRLLISQRDTSLLESSIKIDLTKLPDQLPTYGDLLNWVNIVCTNVLKIMKPSEKKPAPGTSSSPPKLKLICSKPTSPDKPARQLLLIPIQPGPAHKPVSCSSSSTFTSVTTTTNISTIPSVSSVSSVKATQPRLLLPISQSMASKSVSASTASVPTSSITKTSTMPLSVSSVPSVASQVTPASSSPVHKLQPPQPGSSLMPTTPVMMTPPTPANNYSLTLMDAATGKAITIPNPVIIPPAPVQAVSNMQPNLLLGNPGVGSVASPVGQPGGLMFLKPPMNLQPPPSQPVLFNNYIRMPPPGMNRTVSVSTSQPSMSMIIGGGGTVAGSSQSLPGQPTTLVPLNQAAAASAATIPVSSEMTTQTSLAHTGTQSLFLPASVPGTAPVISSMSTTGASLPYQNLIVMPPMAPPNSSIGTTVATQSSNCNLNLTSSSVASSQLKVVSTSPIPTHPDTSASKWRLVRIQPKPATSQSPAQTLISDSTKDQSNSPTTATAPSGHESSDQLNLSSAASLTKGESNSGLILEMQGDVPITTASTSAVVPVMTIGDTTVTSNINMTQETLPSQGSAPTKSTPSVMVDQSGQNDITPGDVSQGVAAAEKDTKDTSTNQRTPSLLSRVASQYGTDIPGGSKLVTSQPSETEGPVATDTLSADYTDNQSQAPREPVQVLHRPSKKKPSKELVAGFPHSLPASVLAKRATRRLFVPVVKVCFENGLYRCKNCRFSTAKANPFRLHLWRDLHRGYLRQKSKGQCLHCPPSITYNRIRHCPYLNNLMAVLEQVKKHSFKELYEKFRENMVRTKSVTSDNEEEESSECSEAENGDSGSEDTAASNKENTEESNSTENESNPVVKNHGKRRRPVIESSDDENESTKSESEGRFRVPEKTSQSSSRRDSVESSNSLGSEPKATKKRVKHTESESSQIGSEEDDVPAIRKTRKPSREESVPKGRTKKRSGSAESNTQVGSKKRDPRKLDIHQKKSDKTGSGLKGKNDPKKRKWGKQGKDSNKSKKLKKDFSKQKSSESSVEDDDDDSEYVPGSEEEDEADDGIVYDDSDSNSFIEHDSDDDSDSDPDWRDPSGEKKGSKKSRVSWKAGKKRKRPSRLVSSEESEESEDSETEEKDKKQPPKKSAAPTKKSEKSKKTAAEKPVEKGILIVAPADDIDDDDTESMTCQRTIGYRGDRKGLSSTRVTAHDVSSRPDGHLKCIQSHCRKDFSTNDINSFRIHYLTSHNLDNILLCFACNGNQPTIEELIEHISKSHPTNWNPLFHCFVNDCSFGTQIMAEYKNHLMNKHMNQTAFRCYYCQASHSSVEQLLEHLKDSMLKFTECPECSVMAELQMTIRNHINCEHPKCTGKATMNVFTSCHRLGPDRDHTLTDKKFLCCCDFLVSDLQEHADHLSMCAQFKQVAMSMNFTSALVNKPKAQPYITPPTQDTGKSTAGKSASNNKGVMLAKKSTAKPAAALSKPHPKKPARKTRPVAKPKTIVERLGKGDARHCTECDYLSQCELLYSAHMAMHGKPPERSAATPFQCTRCPYVSCDGASIVYHMSSHASCPRVRFFRCIHCSFASTSVEITEEHLDSQHPGLEDRFECQPQKLEFACSSCQSNTYTTELLLLEHMSASHGEDVVNTYVKSVYGMDLPAATRPQEMVDLDAGSEDVSIEEDVEEPYPGPSVPPPAEPENQDVLNTSKQDASFGYGLTCSDCGYQSNRFDKWAEHLYSHGRGGDIEVYYCKLCDWPSNDKRVVCSHASSAHGLTRTQAATMGFGTQNLNIDNVCRSLKTRRIPPSQAPSTPAIEDAPPVSQMMYCDECDYSTNNEQEFLWHMRQTHIQRKKSVAKKHTGKVSKKLAKPPRSGKYNPDEDSSQYRWHCEQCPYATNSDSARINHIAQHEKQMMIMDGFKCPYCAYRAVNKSLIKKHQNMYHADNPRAIVPIVRGVCGEQILINTDSTTPPDPTKIATKDSPSNQTPERPLSAPLPPDLHAASSDESPSAAIKSKKKSGVPPLPQSLQESLAQQGITLPDVIEFPQLQKCPRCDHATRLRQVLVRHWNKHEEEIAKASMAGSTSSKGGETELEEESEPETEEERPLTPVHRRRMKKIPDKMLFQCKRCVFMGSDPERVNSHYREKHMETGFRCGHCSYHADKREHIATHSLLKHRQSPLSVIDLAELSDEEIDEDEEQTTLTLSQLYEAIAVYVISVSPFEVTCQMCGTSRRSSSDVQVHILQDHLQFKPYKCKYCQVQGVTQEEMKDHLKRTHPYLGRKVITRKYVGVPPEVIASDLMKCGAAVPFGPLEESPLGLRIENVASISPGMALGNVSALNSWGITTPDADEDSQTLALQGALPFSLKEEDEDPIPSKERPRDDSGSPTPSVSSSGSLSKGGPGGKRRRVFHCMHCSYKSLWNAQDVQKHLASLHLKAGSLGCKYCDYRSSNKREIFDHGKKEHPGQKITACAGNIPNLITKQVGAMVYIGVPGIDVVSPEPSSPNEVPAVSPQQKEVATSKPKETSSSPIGQQTQIKRPGKKRKNDNEEENLFVCKECGYSTSNLNHMFVHILNVHHLLKAFSCSYCGFEDSRIYKVEQHVSKAHPGEQVRVRKVIEERRDKLMKSVIVSEADPDSQEAKSGTAGGSNSAKKAKLESPGLPDFPLGSVQFGCGRCAYTSSLKASVVKHSKKTHPSLNVKWKKFAEEEDKVIIVKEGTVELTSLETTAKLPASPLKMKITHRSDVRVCEQCKLECESSEALEQHILLKHHQSSQGSYHCLYCTSRNKNKYKMKEHCRHKHPGKSMKFSFKLYSEGKSMLSPPAIPKKSSNKQNSITCQLCLQTFLSFKTLELHMYTHVGYTPYQCKDCDYKTHSRLGIRMHYIKRHPGVECRYDYVEDGEKAGLFDALMQDYKQFDPASNKSDPQPGPSSSTGPEGSTEAELSPQVYQCVLCSTKRYGLNKMEQHLYKELKHMRFKCSACAHGAYSRKAMKKHINEEHGKGMASMVHNRNPQVEKHILSLIQQSEVPPDEVPATPPKKPSTVAKGSPLRTDSPTRQDTTCPKCLYVSTSVVGLKKHILTHSPFKWVCGYCPCKTSFRSDLKRHIRIKHPDQEMKMKRINMETGAEDSETDASSLNSSHNSLPGLTARNTSSPQRPLASKKTTEKKEDVKTKKAVLDGVELHEDEFVLGTKPDYICKHCGARNGDRSQTEFSKHLITHLAYYRFKCIFCDKKHILSKEMKRHIVLHHKGAEAATEKILQLRPGCSANSGPRWRNKHDPESQWQGGGELKCVSCDFCCGSSDILKSHELSHQEHKPKLKRQRSKLLGPKCRRIKSRVLVPDFLKMSIIEKNGILARHKVRRVNLN